MFVNLLKQQIILESKNYYNDNYDFYSHPRNPGLTKKLINGFKMLFFRPLFFKTICHSDFLFKHIFLRIFKIDRYLEGLEFFYRNLDDEESRSLLVKLITFRLLGYVKVKLPLSTPEYWHGLKSFEKLKNESKMIRLSVSPHVLYQFSLSAKNIPVDIFMNVKGLYTTFCVEQYKYHNKRSKVIQAEPNDVVLDLGGCFGDTSLYFAHKVGVKGKVFAFEFIEDNIDVIDKNLHLNPSFSSVIEIVKKPVWSKSSIDVFYKSGGPASKVEFSEFQGYDGKSQTISVDDFVSQKGLIRVDFIKTDIEGAEPYALEGAVNTIKRFRPKLAISIYHSMDDFVNIIKYVSELQLGYRFYLGHSTIFASETVLFCSVD